MKDYKKTYREVLGDHFPEDMAIIFGDTKLTYRKKKWKFSGEKMGLRYGDNPGQEAAVYELVDGNLKLGGCEYVSPKDGLITNVDENQLVETGKHLGKSNLTDVDAALNVLKYFDRPTAVIVKHNNPSGVASRGKIRDAYVEANLADRIAAFGGVLVTNRAIDAETAKEIAKNFLEVVAAPGFDVEAGRILSEKKNMRLIKINRLAELKFWRSKRVLEFKTLIDGGLIVQQSANNAISSEKISNAEIERKGKVYSVKRKPSPAEIEDMLFGWKVLQGVISNSMVFAKNGGTVAICAGEQDRVGATELAIIKAHKKSADRLCFQEHGIPLWELKDKKSREKIEKKVRETNAGLKGSVLASDGFLPFRDTIDVAAKEGISGLIQPGGSTRDYQSIEACNEYGISMVFTGKRVFRH